MIRILFICHGNICRSPMAEFIMKSLVHIAGMDNSFIIASAATSSEEIGNPVYPPARRVLAQHGIRCDGKTARRLTPQDYQDYDYLIGMDLENMRDMKRLFSGDPCGKLHLLLEFTGEHRAVSDPWYIRDFDTAYQDITTGCQALFHLLQAQLP